MLECTRQQQLPLARIADGQAAGERWRRRHKLCLNARAKFPNATLADLYNPLSMPPELSKAHAELDRAVDQCYRGAKFESDRERVEFLFQLYEKLATPLTADTEPKKRRKKSDPS